MRDASPDLGKILLTSYQCRLLVDVYYDDEVLFADLPVVDWEISGNIEQAIKETVNLTVAYQGAAGRSLSPRGFTDPLAPYGQQVNLVMEVTFGTLFTERVQIGRYRIATVPDAQDQYMAFGGQTYVSGSIVQLTASDLLLEVQRDGFPSPTPPSQLDSCWAELAALVAIPVARTLDDQPVPGGLVYPNAQGGRLTAVQQIAGVLGGVATISPYGELTVTPYTPGDVVNTLTMGTDGRILSLSRGIDPTSLFNWVTGNYQDADGNPIWAETKILDGPLAVTGPFGPNLYPDSSDTVTTQAQADARVKQVLAQLNRGQTYRITISCLLDFRTQLGDVVQVNGPQAYQGIGAIGKPAFTEVGRVLAYQWGTDGQMTVTLDMALDVPS